MVATALTVVACLHRHASLDSMREVETVQPLASPPNFGRTIHDTPLSTRGNEITFPAGTRSDHKVQVLDDPGGHVFVSSELAVLGARGAHGAPARQPGELEPVQPDRRRRFLAAEVVDQLGATVDADANVAGHRAGQL